MLAGTAASLGLIHTVIGPDHYLPFIVIGRARNWTLRKTLGVAFLAGLGHILSSVILGFLGVALGIAVSKLERVESTRGALAAWLLIGFGLAYFVWGDAPGLAGEGTRAPPSPRAVGMRQVHPHGPDQGRSLPPTSTSTGTPTPTPTSRPSTPIFTARPRGRPDVAPWILFTIFVFGPCEPLIPLVMYPAARHSMAGVALVAAAFGLVTIPPCSSSSPRPHSGRASSVWGSSSAIRAAWPG